MSIFGPSLPDNYSGEFMRIITHIRIPEMFGNVSGGSTTYTKVDNFDEFDASETATKYPFRKTKTWILINPTDEDLTFLILYGIKPRREHREHFIEFLNEVFTTGYCRFDLDAE